jgi:Protein of unknown function (DUF2924)
MREHFNRAYDHPSPHGLQPGTILVREWDGKSQRVMVLDEGFASNGTTYRSLTEIAFAMTGTRRSGLRFFGLRSRAGKPGGRAGLQGGAGKRSRVATGPIQGLSPKDAPGQPWRNSPSATTPGREGHIWKRFHMARENDCVGAEPVRGRLAGLIQISSERPGLPRFRLVLAFNISVYMFRIFEGVHHCGSSPGSQGELT